MWVVIDNYKKLELEF